jgi:hydroxypyruvate isomerase
MHLAANIEWLFTEEDELPARIDAAAGAGLRSVEIWTWREKDLVALAGAAQASGVTFASLCVEPEYGLLGRDGHDAYMRGLEESIHAAAQIGASRLIVLAGDLAGAGAATARPASERPWQDDGDGPWGALREGLEAACTIAEREGAVLLLEPLNTKLDHPDHLLSSTALTLTLIEELDSPGLRLLLDLYHSSMMDEAPADELLRGREQLLAHVHVADMPGRHEPGTGTIDWPRAVGALRAVGYDGAVGLECMPSEATLPSLERARRALGLGG